jgi:mRNA interferase MazF
MVTPRSCGKQPLQGEVWWAEAEDKRRPVLIVSRSEAATHLNRIIVAPVTRTVRGIPTEIPFDDTVGLHEACAASFDNLGPQVTSLLTTRIGQIPFAREQICAALGALADC